MVPIRNAKLRRQNRLATQTQHSCKPTVWRFIFTRSRDNTFWDYVIYIHDSKQWSPRTRCWFSSWSTRSYGCVRSSGASQYVKFNQPTRASQQVLKYTYFTRKRLFQRSPNPFQRRRSKSWTGAARMLVNAIMVPRSRWFILPQEPACSEIPWKCWVTYIDFARFTKKGKISTNKLQNMQ